MRDLEFRAWDGKKMIDDVIPASETSIIELFEYEWQETEVKAVEQYTGLKDKNGKMIYEGDIVRYNIRPSRTVAVEWWSGEEEYYPCCTTSGFALPYSADGYEVIGNIHETPELLEAKDVD